MNNKYVNQTVCMHIMVCVFAIYKQYYQVFSIRGTIYNDTKGIYYNVSSIIVKVSKGAKIRN